MNLYAADIDGVVHNVVMYDGIDIATACRRTFMVDDKPSTLPPEGKLCGRCFPTLN